MRPWPEAALRDLEAAAFAEQHVRRRYAHVLKHHFRRTVGHAVEAEHRQWSQHLDPGRVHRHQDHRLLLVAVCVVRVGLAHEDGDLATRVGGVGGVPLEAVDHVVVAVAHDRAFDVGRVAGRHPGLGHREARADLAGQQRLEPLFLMLGRAVARQHFHVAGVGRAAVKDLGRQEAAAHDLAQWCVLQVRQSRSVLRLGQEQVPQPGGARLGLEFVDDGQHLPRAQRLRLLDVALLFRVDVLVHEGREALLQVLHLGRGFEGHGVSWFTQQPIVAAVRGARRPHKPQRARAT